MSTRRTFLRQSGIFSAAFAFGPGYLFKEDKKIGVQLYTVRDVITKDPKGTLQKIAALGYKEVETFLFEYGDGKLWGLTPAEFAVELRSLGLSSPSGHYLGVSLFYEKDWMEKWKKVMDIAKQTGQEYVVMPWMEEQYRGSADTYKLVADALNKAGEACKQHDIKLAYHGHDFEFTKFGDTTGYDMLLKGTDAGLVNFEIDLYWVTKAGYDPVDLFNKYPHRFPMWHVKDMDATPKKFFTEVGSGIIDFKKIFAHAKTAGMHYFFVEQDFCPGSPFDSLKKSVQYLRKNILT